MKTLISAALLLAPAPAFAAPGAAGMAADDSLEPLCGETTTMTSGGLTFDVGYDCSGKRGVLWARPEAGGGRAPSPLPDRSPSAGSCVGSDYADTAQCQRFLHRAVHIERRLLRIGFEPYDAWYTSIYFTPAERRRAVEVFRACGPSGANDDDGADILSSCDHGGWNGRAYVCGTPYCMDGDTK